MRRRSLPLSILAAAALLLTAGCIKENYLVTNDQTMGNIVDGRFLSDQGVWYDVVEEVNEGDAARLAGETRALVLCDILKNNCTSLEYAYDVRLKDFAHVDVAPVVSLPQVSEEAPMLVDLAWASGAYLNFRIIYLAPETEAAEHSFSVVVEKEPSDLQEIVLHLYHDAGGEYYGAPDTDKNSFKQHARFVSVLLTPYYSADKSYNMHYTLKFSWHKASDDGKSYQAETEIYEVNGNLI